MIRQTQEIMFLNIILRTKRQTMHVYVWMYNFCQMGGEREIGIRCNSHSTSYGRDDPFSTISSTKATHQASIFFPFYEDIQIVVLGLNLGWASLESINKRLCQCCQAIRKSLNKVGQSREVDWIAQKLTVTPNLYSCVQASLM